MQYSVLALGWLMTLIGLGSMFSGRPSPELATAGISAVLASGLLGSGKKA